MKKLTPKLTFTNIVEEEYKLEFSVEVYLKPANTECITLLLYKYRMCGRIEYNEKITR